MRRIQSGLIVNREKKRAGIQWRVFWFIVNFRDLCRGSLAK